MEIHVNFHSSIKIIGTTNVHLLVAPDPGVELREILTALTRNGLIVQIRAFVIIYLRSQVDE